MSIKVKKVKLAKGRTLEATLTEYVLVNEITAQNEVVKKCDYLVHNDLIEAIEKLIPHMINICELACEKDEIKVTGFTLAEASEGEGVVLVGQKTLSTGKVLNLVSPLTELNSDEYVYAEELDTHIQDCIHEVMLYLEEGKSAIKQTAINFDESDESAEVNIGSEEPKKRSRKKKVAMTISAGGERLEVPEMEIAM